MERKDMPYISYLYLGSDFEAIQAMHVAHMEPAK